MNIVVQFAMQVKKDCVAILLPRNTTAPSVAQNPVWCESCLCLPSISLGADGMHRATAIRRYARRINHPERLHQLSPHPPNPVKDVVQIVPL